MTNQMEIRPFAMSMYEQHPDVFEAFKDKFPSIYTLSQMTFSERELDLIVAKSLGAVHHWLEGKTASKRTENRARQYLENLNNPPAQPVLQLVQTTKPKPEMVTFMVNVPADYLEKWQTLSDILKTKGCQVAAF